MRRSLIALTLLVALSCGVAPRAHANVPIAVNAYVHGSVLTITAFSNTTTSGQIVIRMPVGWELAEPLAPFLPDASGAIWNGGLTTTPRVFQLRTNTTTGVGVGTITVVLRDARGNSAVGHAYIDGTFPPAAPAMQVRYVVYFPLLWQH